MEGHVGEVVLKVESSTGHGLGVPLNNARFLIIFWVPHLSTGHSRWVASDLRLFSSEIVL